MKRAHEAAVGFSDIAKISEEILSQLVKMLCLLQNQSKVTGEKKGGGVSVKEKHT